MRWVSYFQADVPQPTSADRAWLERKTGHTLPDAYWEVASRHQGQRPDPGYYRIADGTLDPVGVFLHLLGPERLTDPALYLYGVFPQFESKKHRWSNQLVPFTTDTGGNYLAFDFRGGAGPKVVFLDHDREGRPDGPLPVAHTFETLMASLVANPAG